MGHAMKVVDLIWSYCPFEIRNEQKPVQPNPFATSNSSNRAIIEDLTTKLWKRNPNAMRHEIGATILDMSNRDPVLYHSLRSEILLFLKTFAPRVYQAVMYLPQDQDECFAHMRHMQRFIEDESFWDAQTESQIEYLWKKSATSFDQEIKRPLHWSVGGYLN